MRSRGSGGEKGGSFGVEGQDCSVFGARALTMSFVSGYVHSARAQLSAAK